MDLSSKRKELLPDFLESIEGKVVVEGKKDVKALERLGVTNIFCLNNGNSIKENVEKMKNLDKVTILTDLDKEGKKLRKKLVKYFSRFGVLENEEPREILSKMKIQEIESLQKY